MVMRDGHHRLEGVSLKPSITLAACLGSIILILSACNQAQTQKAASPLKNTTALEPIKAEPGEVPPKDLRKDEPYVKVRRDKDGEYAWEISGKNVKMIIDADRTLRKRFGEGKPE